MVLGSTGQVGAFLPHLLGESGFDCVSLNRQEADLSNPQEILKKLNELKPFWVINAAAYNQCCQIRNRKKLKPSLDQRRSTGDFGAMVQKIRHSIYSLFNRLCFWRSRNQNLIVKPMSPNPLNAYGRTKLEEGEASIVAAGGRSLIFRTSWVYAPKKGPTFLLTMLKLGREKEELNIVNDQWGAPTYARDIAQLTVLAMAKYARR